MKKVGIEIPGTEQPESRVSVAISENLHGVLIVSEVRVGERRQSIFLPWLPPQAGSSSPRLKLELKAIWEQPEPILDFTLLDSGSKLLVLGVEKLSLYDMADGKWKLAGSIPLQLSRPLSRDPRGRLIAEQTIFHVWLPGTSCTGSALPPLGASCIAGNEEWAGHRWVNDRNYLERVGVQGTFYSAAVLENGARRILAGLDGRVRDQVNETVSGASGWGSDLAGPFTVCGSASLVLATSASERDASDSVAAYEIAAGAETPSSEAVPLPGPVVALWPAGDRDQANVVVRNARRGSYEASRLRLACAE